MDAFVEGKPRPPVKGLGASSDWGAFPITALIKYVAI
jgi:hypothetical protein